MTKFSLNKVALAAFGGAAALTIVVLAATPADASTGGSKFRASPEDLRRHCWRIDETFWKSKRRYGCGDVVRCAEGTCVRISTMKPPPPPPPPPQLTREPGKNGDGGGGNGGGRGNNNRDGGKKGGEGGSSSAAGGPN